LGKKNEFVKVTDDWVIPLAEIQPVGTMEQMFTGEQEPLGWK
jgi:hypothetical protein